MKGISLTALVIKIDAITGIENEFLPQINQFLKVQLAAIELSQKIEHNHILRTKVDFKIMEQD